MVNRSAIKFSAFAPANFEQMVMGKSQAQADQKPEYAIKYFFAGSWFAENGDAGVHAHHCKPRRKAAFRALRACYTAGTKRSDAEFMQ